MDQQSKTFDTGSRSRKILKKLGLDIRPCHPAQCSKNKKNKDQFKDNLETAEKVATEPNKSYLEMYEKGDWDSLMRSIDLRNAIEKLSTKHLPRRTYLNFSHLKVQSLFSNQTNLTMYNKLLTKPKPWSTHLQRRTYLNLSLLKSQSQFCNQKILTMYHKFLTKPKP